MSSIKRFKCHHQKAFSALRCWYERPLKTIPKVICSEPTSVTEAIESPELHIAIPTLTVDERRAALLTDIEPLKPSPINANQKIISCVLLYNLDTITEGQVESLLFHVHFANAILFLCAVDAVRAFLGAILKQAKTHLKLTVINARSHDSTDLMTLIADFQQQFDAVGRHVRLNVIP